MGDLRQERANMQVEMPPVRGLLRSGRKEYLRFLLSQIHQSHHKRMLCLTHRRKMDLPLARHKMDLPLAHHRRDLLLARHKGDLLLAHHHRKFLLTADPQKADQGMPFSLCLLRRKAIPALDYFLLCIWHAFLENSVRFVHVHYTDNSLLLICFLPRRKHLCMLITIISLWF